MSRGAERPGESQKSANRSTATVHFCRGRELALFRAVTSVTPRQLALMIEHYRTFAELVSSSLSLSLFAIPRRVSPLAGINPSGELLVYKPRSVHIRDTTDPTNDLSYDESIRRRASMGVPVARSPRWTNRSTNLDAKLPLCRLDEIN